MFLGGVSRCTLKMSYNRAVAAASVVPMHTAAGRLQEDMPTGGPANDFSTELCTLQYRRYLSTLNPKP